MAGQHVRGAAKAADLKLGILFGRQLFPLSLVALVLYLVRDQIPALDIGHIWTIFQEVRTDQWALAALATGASFWAVGRYDSVMHGLMGTDVSQQNARQSGVTAIAVAQFAGFGVITGALVRWHLLPGLSLGRAFRVSLAVAITFLTGWAVVTAAAVLLAGLDTPHLDNAAKLVLGFTALAGIVLLITPTRIPNLPTLRCLATILGLVLVDTAFAALALYALLPVGIDIAPITLFAVFLIALGAGLMGGTPGGVGPFELSLLALLPTIPDGSILASALAFRVIYYALPAALGLIALAIGFSTTKGRPVPILQPAFDNPFLPAWLERHLWAAPRAEVNLIRQGNLRTLMDGPDPVAIAAPVGQNLVMLGDPIATRPDANNTLRLLRDLADSGQRAPLVYKCSGRTALAARNQGWHVLPVAKEAWINPTVFNTVGAPYRQLRRSLRTAQKSGVCVTEAGRDLPIEEMQALSKRWQSAHGGENRFSMGVFDADYVSCQRVFLAYHEGKLTGFATFHETRNEWCLDLMRNDQDTTSGTMHLLIEHAIQSAAAVRCKRFSLAAVPHNGAGDGPWLAPVRQALLGRRNFAGLKRFKSCFNPNWETRYALSRSGVSMLLGLWSLYARINKPG